MTGPDDGDGPGGRSYRVGWTPPCDSVRHPGVPPVFGDGCITDSDEPLTDRDREILAFERRWWKYPASKETAVRELFGLSPTRYYQVLNALIDTPAALAADPMLVKRLRRARDARHRGRADRISGVR
jgi:hypothetical protein